MHLDFELFSEGGPGKNFPVKGKDAYLWEPDTGLIYRLRTCRLVIKQLLDVKF